MEICILPIAQSANPVFIFPWPHSKAYLMHWLQNEIGI